MKTAKPFYHPGDQVTGNIYIRLMVPMNASTLEIKVKGKEKAKFIRYYSNGQSTWSECIRYEHKHIEFKGVCFTFNGPLNPGDYTIPFEFDLPNDIPGSICFRDDTRMEKPKAEIKYTVKAVLNTVDNRVLKYK